MATRPVEICEYKEIISLLNEGFTYGDNKVFRPNQQIALALQIQANLGLRIGDTLELKLSNFKNGRLEIREDKTDKLQYREVNQALVNMIMEYALEKNLSKDSIYLIYQSEQCRNNLR